MCDAITRPTMTDDLKARSESGISNPIEAVGSHAAGACVRCRPR
jgi:hypothetical protein